LGQKVRNSSLQALMRRARKALNNNAYDEACECYEVILSHDSMEKHLDMMLRYAWCLEHCEKISQACDVYEKVMQQYQDDDELAAVQSLQDNIDRLKLGESALADEPDELDDVSPLDDESLMQHLKELGEIVELCDGDVLCRSGDFPNCLWLLEKGKLSVQMLGYDNDPPDSLIAEGDGHLVLVGELGLFTQVRRSATLTASSMCKLWRISARSIEACHVDGFQAGMENFLRDHWVYPVLSRHEIFERMNDIDRHRLSKKLEVVSIHPGDVLLEKGEEHAGAYLLQQGCLFCSPNGSKLGKDTNQHFDSLISVLPGDIVNIGGLLRNHPSSIQIVAATPVRLLYLSCEVFEEFALRRPWIIQAVLRYANRPANAQIMRPDEGYLWKTDRQIKLRMVT